MSVKKIRQRRRAMRRNPLSTKQKLAGIGGLAILGGVAAFALMSPSTASADAPPGGPPVDPRIAKAAECAALQQQLAQLRGQAAPDRSTVAQLEAQIAACVAQARELGAPVDPAVSTLSAGDASYAQMQGWWEEYKATSEHDPLKRNNTRQSILTAGTALAAAYGEALVQSTTTASTKLVAQSILRALDAAISRQLCFLGNERGCGTFGANEDQPDAKAAQEQERVIVPLRNVYAQAVAKVGGPSRAIADADGELYLSIILRPCTFMKGYIDVQMGNYRNTEWSDALKRNNTRMSINAASRDLVACLRGVFASATSFNSITSIRAVLSLTVAALNAAVDRWICFTLGGSGCGTFAANEDQPDVKAAQEWTASVDPLTALALDVATATGDTTAFEPIVTARLRACSAMKDFVDAQFSHYTATEWSDALKRNNTRGSMLAMGARISGCLQQTLEMADRAYRVPGRAVPASMITSALTSGIVLSFAPTAGLGAAVASAPKASLVAAPQTATVSSLPPTSAATAARTQAAVRMGRAIAAVTRSALDAAVSRRLCYLYNGTGCGTFGVNEDQPDVKAAQEQERVIAPLVVVYKNVVKFLADRGDTTAETPLVTILLRDVTAAKDFINSQYSSLKATSYIDPAKRINIRNSMIAAGQRMLTSLRNTKPMTPAARASVRSVAQSALVQSREREACYRSGGAGCDQQWGTFTEGSGAAKADQEASQIGNPLAALLADTSPLGLGSDVGEDNSSAYMLLGAAGLIGVALYVNAHRKPVRKNRRASKRTSRRRAA